MPEHKTEKVKKKSAGLVKLKDLEVRGTELTFVTSVNYVTGQFFCQFCKFSNEELINFNNSVNEQCQKIIGQRAAGDTARGLPNTVRKGNIFCVKFYADGVWYRVEILKCHKEDSTCTVRFIDYGNEEIVGAAELLEVDPKDLPSIEREPFGITCSPADYEDSTKQEIQHLLDCLHNNYAMIKPTERLATFDWKVKIPKHAYNNAFWLIFNTDSDGIVGAQKSGQSDAAKSAKLEDGQTVSTGSS